MRKSILYFALPITLLLMMAANQIAFAEADEDDNTVEIDIEAMEYSELNALIDEVIFQKLSGFVQFLRKGLLTAWAFFLSWPALIKNTLLVSMFSASIGIITSHVLGIYGNRNEWYKHPDHNLMYSYFIKSGALQRKKSYIDAHTLLRDRRWLWVSFAGLAFRLGNYDNKSIMLMFVMSFVYIPLSVLGFVEMVLRIFFGTIWLVVFNLIHRFLLSVTKLISFLMIPVSTIIDKILRNTQYCPHCYETFMLPEFICPSCGKVHKQLIPGNCGVLFVRCSCNKVFLPCTAFTGRSRLVSRCPACTGELVAANAKHFSLALIGGHYAGKTAFIAALSNLYSIHIKKRGTLTIEGKPGSYFDELRNMFRSGKTEFENEPRTYSIVHKHGKREKDNLVLYDTLAENIVSNSFPRSPKYFGFCDGIILIIDPLSVQYVRDVLAKDKDGKKIKDYSVEDTDKFVVQFIHLYTTIRGSSTGKMSDVPFAVLINKTDIKVVQQEIGLNEIKALYDKNPSDYGDDEHVARDKICRAYLSKIGLSNMLNHIEATFTNVSFFPVSAIGHLAEEGTAYAPTGVIEPVVWIAKEKRFRKIAGLFNEMKL